MWGENSKNSWENTSDLRRCLKDMDVLCSSQGLVLHDDVLSFDSAFEQLQLPTRLLSRGPIDYLNYFNRWMVQLMRNSCVAG